MKKILIPVFASFMIFAGTFTNTNNTAEAATPTELIQVASQYKGIPYRYGGTTTAGFDCSGYTSFVFKQLGISLPRTSAGQYGVGTAVSKANLQVGDLVFFNTSGRGVSHVGIYIGNNNFIHSSSSKGVSVASIYDPYYWGKRYIGAKRVATFTEAQQQQVTQVPEVKPAAIDFSVFASRQAVATKLVQALGLDTTDTSSKFVDVKAGSEFAGITTALYNAGIFSGDGEGKFNLGSALTRAEMAKVLVEAYDLTLQPGNAMVFTDVPASHWAHSYIQILASNGITNGKGNGVYGINDNVELAHLDLFIERSANK